MIIAVEIPLIKLPLTLVVMNITTKVKILQLLFTCFSITKVVLSTNRRFSCLI
nr:MAG TPA: hypothetical protein [Bacteriophage sp.]